MAKQSSETPQVDVAEQLAPAAVATMPNTPIKIPETDVERAAIQKELDDPPYKPVQKMSKEERQAYYIRRRQMFRALEGKPDDTKPEAKAIIRKCCG
jgi:hypothetical protein